MASYKKKPKEVGANTGQQGHLDPKNAFSQKMILDHVGCQNKCFWHVLSLQLPFFGPPKIPKCLENGLFWGEQSIKNGSKICFPKNDPGAFGVPKQWKLAYSEPIVSHFSPSRVKKCLKHGLFWDQK